MLKRHTLKAQKEWIIPERIHSLILDSEKFLQMVPIPVGLYRKPKPRTGLACLRRIALKLSLVIVKILRLKILHPQEMSTEEIYS